MGETEEKGFTVQDRRAFSAEGESLRGQAEPEAPKGETRLKPPPRTEERPRPEEKPPLESEARRQGPLPAVTFATFVFSLSSSALFHLGDIPDPQTNKPEVDLGMAKQTIDLLGLLKEKTKGNLDDEEQRLLDGILYDLRMRYVKKINASEQPRT